MAEIPFPLNGRDDSAPHGKQALTTTREAINVRWMNPRTGRGGGARRAGLRKASQLVGAGALRGTASLAWDSGVQSFAELAAPVEVWADSDSSKKAATSVKADGSGNSFVLAGGTRVTVRNKDGAQTASVTLPGSDTGKEYRALAVDADTGQFYVGVSDGGSQPRAEVVAYRNDPELGWQIAWQLVLGLFVEKLEIYGGDLYAAANDTDTGRAYLVQIGSVSTSGAEIARTQVNAPATVEAISEKGRVAVGSGFNASRGFDPRYPNTGQILDRSFASWWYTDIAGWTDLRWAVFDPSEIDLDVGDDVIRWDSVPPSERYYEMATQTVHLSGLNSIGTLSGTPADGDTVTASLPDGTYSETYTWKTVIAAAGHILIGASATTAMANLEAAVEGGAGAGTTYHQDTPSSSLFFMSNNAGGSATFKCNTTREVVLLSEVSANLSFSSSRIASQVDREPTAPTLKVGLSGRRSVYFDGITSKMLTRDNASQAPANADQQHTLWPAYGTNQSVSASARFFSLIVLRPYTQYVKAAAISQNVLKSGGGTWVRRIVANRNSTAAGATYAQGWLGVVENDNGTVKTYARNMEAETNYAGFVMIAMVHNPDAVYSHAVDGSGQFEVYINGFPAGRNGTTFATATWVESTKRLTQAGIGTAAAAAAATHVVVTGGTDVLPGVYEIVSFPTANTIELATSLSAIAADLSAADIAGYYLDAIGQAVANDGLGMHTAIGQSSYAPEDERFWQGEMHLQIIGHSTSDGPIQKAERQLAEGAVAWYFGFQSQLPANHPYYAIPPPPVGSTTADWYLAKQAMSFFPSVTVLDGRTRELSWIATSDGTSAHPLGALGSGLVWLSDERLISIGPPVVIGTDAASVRAIVDKIDDYSTDPADGAWSVTIGDEQADSFSYDKLELARDSFDNIYIPWQNKQDDTTPPKSFLMLSSSGAEIMSPEAEGGEDSFSIAVDSNPDFTGADVTRAESIVLAHRVPVATVLTMLVRPNVGDTLTFVTTLAGSVNTEVYDYGGDIAIGATVDECIANTVAVINGNALRSDNVTAVQETTTTIRFVARQYEGETTAAENTSGARLAFSLATLAEDDFTNARRFKLVQSTAPTGETLRRTLFGVVNGDVKVFTDSATATPTNGTGALDPNARYTQSTTLLGLGFITDGNKVVYYDPRSSRGSGEVFPYTSRTPGSFPEGVLGLESWRARLIAFGLRQDPYSFFGTAVGEPFNCDTNPPETNSVTRAFLRPIGGAGQIDDIITGFIPYSDAMRLGAEISAIVLGDHSMHRLIGDPTDGGRRETISNMFGGARGRAWGLGPRGEVYVWSQTGGLMVLAPGAGPQPFSGRNLARVFEAVDLQNFYVRLAWDWKQDGLVMAACPYGGVDGASKLFFWERSVGAFWEDETAHRITDLIVVDADKPDDRMTLVACADGYARTFDFSGGDDDGSRVYSHVVIGPLQAGRFQVELLTLQALIEHSGEPMQIEVWASRTTSSIGRMVRRFELRPGMSPEFSVRSSGNFLWIILRGTSAWSLESLQAEIGEGAVLRAGV